MNTKYCKGPAALAAIALFIGTLTGVSNGQSSGEATTGTPAELKKTLTLDLGGGVRMEFVLIPAGAFTMGSEKSPQANERPTHEVRIDKPFYLGRYEVTQEQWVAIMGSNPSVFLDPRRPVETINWDECQGFLSKLNKKVGSYEIRMPTEAQWEYACRAGEYGDYSLAGGEASLGEHAWYANNANGQTHPVGGKKPNYWGLYDMLGNVWEWCETPYGAYQNPPVPDPMGLYNRVLRGGAWDFGAGYNRAAFRNGNIAPVNRYYDAGLRCALVIETGR
jgi:formylglycine-generating enzyme required for sulfatase activity